LPPSPFSRDSSRPQPPHPSYRAHRSFGRSKANRSPEHGHRLLCRTSVERPPPVGFSLLSGSPQRRATSAPRFYPRPPARSDITAFAHPRSIMSCHPQTPQSPSQFSPNTSDLMMSMTGSVTSTTTTLPTPAHSVNGSSIPSEMTQDTVMGDDSPHKRKRDGDDMGGRAQKKVHVEDRNLGIDDLHLDVGEKYLLCRTRKTPFYTTCIKQQHVPRQQRGSPLRSYHGACGPLWCPPPPGCHVLRSQHTLRLLSCFPRDLVNVLTLQRTLGPGLTCRKTSLRGMA
jgi:hypothetical protein